MEDTICTIVNSQGYAIKDILWINTAPYATDCLLADKSAHPNITIYDQTNNNAVIGTADWSIVDWGGDPLWWDDMYDRYLANLEKDQTPPSTDKEPNHG